MKFQHILLGALVATIWGINFTVSKLGMGYFPPILINALRMMLVAIILLPFVKRTDLSFKTLLSFSIVNAIGHHACLFIAIWLGLDLPICIIITQASAPLTAILSIFLLNDKPSIKVIMGTIVAFIGVVVTVGDPRVGHHAIPLIFAIIGAISLSGYNILLKKAGKYDVMSMLAYSSLISAVLLFTLSFIFEQPKIADIQHAPIGSLISIIYMSIASTIVGFGLWFYLIQHYSVNLVAPFALLVPIVGYTATSLILKETINFNEIVGGVITLMGLALINLPFSLSFKKGIRKAPNVLD